MTGLLIQESFFNFFSPPLLFVFFFPVAFFCCFLLPLIISYTSVWGGIFLLSFIPVLYSKCTSGVQEGLASGVRVFRAVYVQVQKIRYSCVSLKICDLLQP